jgi:hypothetical protein
MRTFAIALLGALLLAGAADARKKRTYCQKAVSAQHGKLVKRTGGVTVYRTGRLVNACSDAKRFNASLYGMAPGYKVTGVFAKKSRCLAVLMTASGKLPEVLYKDLGDKTDTSSTVDTIGFNHAAATVGSMAVTNNCAAAWGESITDGEASTYRVRVRGFGKATDLSSGVTEIATVTGPADIRKVTAATAGRKVVVKWTQAGAAQSKTVPE